MECAPFFRVFIPGEFTSGKMECQDNTTKRIDNFVGLATDIVETMENKSLVSL
jgi:hypothetical protein